MSFFFNHSISYSHVDKVYMYYNTFPKFCINNEIVSLLVPKVLHGEQSFHLFKHRSPVPLYVMTYGKSYQPSGFECWRSFSFLTAKSFTS